MIQDHPCLICHVIGEGDKSSPFQLVVGINNYKNIRDSKRLDLIEASRVNFGGC